MGEGAQRSCLTALRQLPSSHIVAQEPLRILWERCLTLCGKGSRGPRGRRSGFVRARNVAKLPGAVQDPSNACLAEDSSPNWAARSALNSTESARAWWMRRLTCLLAQTQQMQPMTLGEKRVNRSCNCFLGIFPPREPRYNNNRGTRRNNFHPLTPNLVELRTTTFNFLESQPQTRTEWQTRQPNPLHQES